MEFFINALPALMPLVAALIVCVISFVRDFSTNKFVTIFVIVVVLFYIIGLVVKRILGRQYNEAMEAYMEQIRLEEEQLASMSDEDENNMEEKELQNKVK